PERSDPEQGVYFWVYTIEIRNLGDIPVQLKTRSWRITDGLGRVQEVRGSGVVGEQPRIAPGEAYDYSSGCPLTTPSGIMQGHYT
ncbi:Co2+/Mg2+ efflux protein ApaG, partial [Mycobacterium tuberculosis]|nr:Co2+/Mg2+ efflux protein ApaG [Mycobacterium tuberculosis]